MDDLLKEIRSKNEAAASVLENAGLRADSDLRSLTLQELGELLPGAENFKLRREIFDIIQTQKPIGELIKEFKNFIPHESLGTTLTENGILVNYLKMLKEMKNQMQTVQDFLDAHIRLLEDIRKSQPSQDQDKGSLSSSDNSQTGDPPQIQQDTSTSSSMLPPPSTTSTGDHPQKRKGEIMDVLLKKIRSKDGKAASVLEQAGLRADSDLQLLTLQELGELFPGVENIKWRREIFAIIQTQKPIDVLIEEFKDFIRHESLRAALTENGVLVDYLKMLKEMKTQMKTVQGFLDAHINLLEDLRKSQPSQDQDKDRTPSAPSITSTHGQTKKRQVTYKMVVSGVTFDADKQLLDRVTTSSGDRILKLLNEDDGEVIIVFCPVVSRTGTDVEAAMAQVTGDKPVILVVMHHAYEARSVSSAKTWKDSCKVVLCVHVFYHEKVPGLLPCQENNDAISKIQTELLNYGVDITESTSGDNQSWLSFLVSKFTEKK
ncbi:uncharacterized protein LOC112841729 isoform X1 [Oreochromis niloticus]|uniref:uncharacterized protein LOC112841729 isoform X1 n=1 Tax=Oreochromis niloticus TaxID=8128 RepID=UPI0003943FC0|nr:uncharacterized protein LOC112841729 isoform X1 [Oreochromis niloticus]